MPENRQITSREMIEGFKHEAASHVTRYVPYHGTAGEARKTLVEQVSGRAL